MKTTRRGSNSSRDTVVGEGKEENFDSGVPEELTIRRLPMMHINIALSAIAALAIATLSGAAPVSARSKTAIPIYPQYTQQAPQRQQLKKAETFVGTVRKSRHGFVPRIRGRIYRLEGAAEAANYVSNRVLVRGVLNIRTRAIEVSSIQSTT